MLLLICLTLKGAITVTPTPPTPPTPSGGGGSGGAMYISPLQREEKELMESIRIDDLNIINAIKIFLECQ